MEGSLTGPAPELRSAAGDWKSRDKAQDRIPVPWAASPRGSPLPTPSGPLDTLRAARPSLPSPRQSGERGESHVSGSFPRHSRYPEEPSASLPLHPPPRLSPDALWPRSLHGSHSFLFGYDVPHGPHALHGNHSPGLSDRSEHLLPRGLGGSAHRVRTDRSFEPRGRQRPPAGPRDRSVLTKTRRSFGSAQERVWLPGVHATLTRTGLLSFQVRARSVCEDRAPAPRGGDFPMTRSRCPESPPCSPEGSDPFDPTSSDS